MMSGWWSRWTSTARAVVETARHGHPGARALAVADSRSMVRALFLASAVQTGLLPYLRTARRFDDIAQRIDCRRSDRLHAWLGVGVDLGELGSHGETYRVIGRRGRALAEGDHLLVAHYRSMLEYQGGPYADLASLL